jgi:hypothetical protein
MTSDIVQGFRDGTLVLSQAMSGKKATAFGDPFDISYLSSVSCILTHY